MLNWAFITVICKAKRSNQLNVAFNHAKKFPKIQNSGSNMQNGDSNKRSDGENVYYKKLCKWALVCYF